MENRRPRSGPPKLVYADEQGNLYDHPHLLMVEDRGAGPVRPPEGTLVPVPRGSDFYTLPGRQPIGMDPNSGEIVTLDGPFCAVSTFLAPAWLRLAHPAFEVGENAPTLPLFAYAAMGFSGDSFWTSGIRVDPEPRQDPWLFDLEDIGKRVTARRAKSPKNRLIKQLDRCALEYGCRAAQNYFLGRFEAPLPTSEGCNATCVGCISLDPLDTTAAHERILQSPGPLEIAEVAVEHIHAVEHAVVSFGQGCEGEPLLRAPVLEAAIRRIREQTDAGTIHLNSNASLPQAVDQLCRAGLQSMRISLNAVTEAIYTPYYRPRTYRFSDVIESARTLKRHGGFLSLNLLVFPGVNDREPELTALSDFVADVGVDMIQMRNLNVDPVTYRDILGAEYHGPGIGLDTMMERLKDRFPHLRFGYFNPPHQSFRQQSQAAHSSQTHAEKA